MGSGEPRWVVGPGEELSGESGDSGELSMTSWAEWVLEDRVFTPRVDGVVNAPIRLDDGRGVEDSENRGVALNCWGPVGSWLGVWF